MLSYYKELIYYVQRMVGDKDNAKDVVQEAYFRMLKVNQDINNERAYLYKLSRNIVIDQARKHKITAQTVYEEEQHTIPHEQQPDELAYKSNQHKVLMEIVLSLPTKNQQAFILHVIDGFSRKEISIKMGISIAAVEKHIIRASEKIKDKLSDIQ
ncbi:MAG: RNA polymerase sigma factor [Campylobacteraceae bacterium]|nr:RNA polymerase sigma factor [Campylobacteraceae bacterium]